MFQINSRRGLGLSQTIKFSAIICLSFVAACTGVEANKLTPAGHEILFRTNTIPGGDSHERLRQSAFVSLQGMTRSEALLYLAEAGFVCAETTCRHTTTDRVTSFEVAANLVNRNDRNGVARNEYSITILNPTIVTPADLSATYTNTFIKGN